MCPSFPLVRSYKYTQTALKILPVLSFVLDHLAILSWCRVERQGRSEGRREWVRVSGYGIGAMSGEKPSVDQCKGVNGLDKVVLREVKGSSAEVRFVSFNPSLDLLLLFFFSFIKSFRKLICGIFCIGILTRFS